MRIAAFGNMANAAYVLCKLLRSVGLDITLILDRDDLNFSSQPVWEDVDFGIQTDLAMSGKLPRSFWENLEARFSWKRPKWIVEVPRIRPTGWSSYFSSFRNMSLTAKCLSSLRLDFIWKAPLLVWQFESVIDEMKKHDIVLAYGLGSVWAHFSGVPYFSIPHGSDIRTIPFLTRDSDKMNRAMALLQRSAYSNAKSILVADPSFVDCLVRINPDLKWQHFPFPIDPETCSPNPNVKPDELLDGSMAEKASKSFVYFVPSRTDFHWKGTDKLIRAFARCRRRSTNLLMIFSGWGRDIEPAKRLVQQLGIEDGAYFLPNTLSKIRLVKFFNMADVVVDQFSLGIYGMSALEAMACGKPVVTYLDLKKYETDFDERPPVVLAQDEDQIADALTRLYLDEGFRKEMGAASRRWVLEAHYRKSVDCIKSIIDTMRESA